MSHHKPTFRFQLGLVAPLLLAFSSGCTATTTNVVAHEAPPVTRLHLSRADAEPLSATFLQEGHSIRGTLSLTNECSLDTTRTTRSERTTTTKQSTGTTVAWFIASGVVTAAGIGFMAASPHQDKRVICGNGDTVRAGDTCDSTASVFMQSGATTLGIGLGMAAVGVLGLVQKPKVKTESLPPQQVTTSTSDSACGNADALDGMVIAMELPNGGRWTGRVERDGTFRIDVDSEVPLPAGEARFFIDNVTPPLDAVVVRGTPVGTLTLARSSNERTKSRASSGGPAVAGARRLSP